MSSDDDDLEQEAVVAVEEEQAGRAVLRDLAGDLAADRSAGAGDENGRAFEVVGDVARVDRCVLAAEEVGEVEVAQAVQERLALRVGRSGEHLHLRVGLQRALRSRRVARVTASGQRDHDAVDALAPAHLFEVVRRAEHAQRAHRTADELRVVVDEADDDRVAEGAAFELERQRDAGVGGADDQRAQTCALAVTLTLEREQAGLEPDATAAEEDEQRGDRRRGEDRQGHVLHVGEPRQRERRREDAGGNGGDDAHRFFDRRVPPDRSVEPHHLIDDELGDDRDQQVRDESAHAERRVAREAGEKGEEPGAADDAEVEHPQAGGAAALSDAVHGAREPMWIRRRARTLAQRRCRKSTHPCTPPPAQPGNEPVPSDSPPQILARSAPSVNRENSASRPPGPTPWNRT